MITIKHLQIFQEVARVKSMSQAAKNLYISQPTISQKIQEIEDEYHIKLFQRTHKTLLISEEGTSFLKYSTKILNELDEMDDYFLNNNVNKTIRLGATLTVGCTIIPQLLKEIQLKYPNINIQITIDNTQYIENLLLENKLDIGIVEGDIRNPKIIKEPIIQDQLVFISPSSHPLTKYKIIQTSQLAQYPFILREKGSGTRAKFDQFMNRYKVDYHTAWTCHSWESIKQAVLNDFGLSIISIHMIENEIKSGQLKILNVENWDCHRSFFICYHETKELNDNLLNIIHESKNFSHCPILDYIS
ncbi:MAG: LysR family transcriptional regulator [Erysipelotrichaceae bacterium]|nr:LysR family transcriptional regulator [Erysipelotrichaceae bacterium]